MTDLLDLTGDPADLTRVLCDLESVSGNEGPLADLVERTLRTLPHLSVTRYGDAVLARTELGRAERVVLAGHIDTVPLAAAANLPTWLEGDRLYGRGTCDMKGGVAVQLALAAALPEPSRDLTFVFYDGEEVESERNGLGRISREAPDQLAGDFAVLLEPTSGNVEGGCNGTIRVDVTMHGRAAHSARAWMGHNAIHDAAVVLGRLTAYDPQDVEVEGLVFRESLNAVRIDGGVAGNVIPDRCVVSVNYRFAPSKSVQDAEHHLRELFTGLDVVVSDAAGGARPGLDRPMAKAFLDVIGKAPGPKYGWTDVARFSELGMPAVNFGPGDPLKAHADDEFVPVEQIRHCLRVLKAWLA
ncbi:succinyl-diaminopimelate desuccinylase [Angustibacter sp. McL0619]|uniref:succinyl-diaminopimelate desuccinylase n=1 Tax=Angustibacter sp. McL0619 TaxID=3415676 RepID=UPI003CF10385